MQKASKNFIINLKKQKRENRDLLFLDNVKIIKDALTKNAIQPEFILTSLSEEEFEALGINTFCHLKSVCKDFGHPTNKSVNVAGSNTTTFEMTGVERCREISFPIYQIDQSTIEALADTKTPQKVLCIAYHTQDVVQVPNTNFLVLDGLQDPGNVGTLIRTAKASDFEFVFLVDSVNKSNAKLIRSSVGAVFDNKVFEVSKAEFIDFAKKNKLQLICTDMNGENIFDFAEKLNKKNSDCHAEQMPEDFVILSHEQSECVEESRWHTSHPLGIVIGNEGQGVSQDVRALCKKTVSIPMCEGIESLNAAVSGSIIMYEINKENFKGRS